MRTAQPELERHLDSLNRLLEEGDSALRYRLDYERPARRRGYYKLLPNLAPFAGSYGSPRELIQILRALINHQERLNNWQATARHLGAKTAKGDETTP